MKRADISLQIIVVAALALLVLTVLLTIFAGQMGKFSFTIKDCEGTLYGTCKSSCIRGEETTQYKTSCSKDKDAGLCCIPIDIQAEKGG